MLPRCGAGTFSAAEEKKIGPLTVGLTGKRYISRQRLEYLKGSELHVLRDVMLFTTPDADPIPNLHDISTAVSEPSPAPLPASLRSDLRAEN